MGFLDDLKNMISGGDVDLDAIKAKFSEVMPDVDLASLKEKFDASGLGDKVQSWISSGENLSVSPEEIKSALGDNLGGIAEKMGTSVDDAAAKLSETLPGMVDKLTPNGTL